MLLGYITGVGIVMSINIGLGAKAGIGLSPIVILSVTSLVLRP